VLPFTMDELWGHLPGPREDSVHLADFPSGLDALADEALVDRWSRLLRLRAVVNAEIERLRQQKAIGTSLEARVDVEATGETARLLQRYEHDLATLFMTSQASLQAVPAIEGDEGDPRLWTEAAGSARVTVGRADGVKCQRCWRYVPAVSRDPELEGLCARCENAVAGLASRTGS
jgi:isoleucyl-tRNA synthetase